MTKEIIWPLGMGEVGLASVIVTAYNQKEFLIETLESVAAQTYRPIECIIVDDGSDDETPETIKHFIGVHSRTLRIKSIRQENQGAQRARNTGIKASSGEFVQFLDGDDLLGPDKITCQVEMLSSQKGTAFDVVYGDSKWLDEVPGGGFRIGDDIRMGPSPDVLETMLNQRWNPMFSYLCRRSAVQANGPWNPAVPIAQDVDYFLRMASRGFGFGHVPVMAGLYRKHFGPRISDGRMALRARTMLTILKSTEELGEKTGVLTSARRRALAGAYRRISYWAYGLDRPTWKESLEHFLRLCPDLPPESWPAQCLQSLVGIWRSEIVLGVLRDCKRRLLEQVAGARAPTRAPRS
jgi:glycosyltransferase involved in cell wall biosynthesis